MTRYFQGLRPAGIALVIIIFLDLIGLPITVGPSVIWVFALFLALFSFFISRQKRGKEKLTALLAQAFLISLIPALGLAFITNIFAHLQGSGVQVNIVFAQILPAHTAALTGLSPAQLFAGENALPGLLRLILIMTAAGFAGGALGLLRLPKSAELWGSARLQGTRSKFSFILPFLLFGAYLALRLPAVELLGTKENILGLLLLYLFFASVLFSLRAIESRRTRIFFIVAVGALLLLVPFLNDLFQNSVLGFVAIFIVMGIGLNIVVGFAGMLDLGYVAFFAVGAYSYAMLSSPTSWVLLNVPGFAGIPFWAALPLAIVLGAAAGIMLGIPVLRLRGDYLAIVTLGFGEIIRLILLNLRTYTGGPGGVLDVPPPFILGHSLGNPRDLLFLSMAFAGLMTFLATRLRDSRIGRAWIAMREDERVAQAMGINLIAAKLLAFAFGAVFAAISGTIYASRQVNIFPDNFALDVSINVLCLIVIGGIGSIEGVILGAIALIGLPEILRSVSEYRIIAFGALLVAMMILRPEGLLPSRRRKRELHAAQAENAPSPGKMPG